MPHPSDTTTPKRIYVGIVLAVLLVLSELYGTFLVTPARHLPLTDLVLLGAFILLQEGLSVASWIAVLRVRGVEAVERARVAMTARAPAATPNLTGPLRPSWSANPLSPDQPTVATDPAAGPVVRRLLRQVRMTGANVEDSPRVFALTAAQGPFRFGATSEAALRTVHPDVVRVLRRAIQYVDFTVLEGHRGQAAQNDAFARGDSKLRYPCGNHNATPSDAADIAPFPVDWSNAVNARDRFVYLAGVVMCCAAMEGVRMRWGGDWNSNSDTRDEPTFRDFPHFERRQPNGATIIRCP
jgi:peptidoglycan L-alanyl-D-glutamate endopeptidase CwlK